MSIVVTREEKTITINVSRGSSGGGSVAWGGITGNLANQTDLANQQTAQDVAIALNTDKLTNATHTGDVTGATALTIPATTISNKTAVSSLAGTEEVLVNEAGTLKKTTTQAIADLGGGGGTIPGTNVSLNVTNLKVAPFAQVQAFSDGLDAAVLKARGTGVTTSYVSSVAVGGTTFAQPDVSGEINSDEGYFSITHVGATGISVDNLTARSTFVYIDNAGNRQQQTTEPTRQDWSRKMFTMRIAVDTSTNLILGFEYLNNPIGHYANSIRDLYTALIAQGVPFKGGQIITGRASDLGFDVSAGTIMEFGGTGDINNANILGLDAVANATYDLLTRTTVAVEDETDLVKFWDNAGVITALGSTTVVGHRLYRFSNGQFAMQYGQGNYANIVLARAGVLLEDYELNPRLLNATFFGWWLIQETATNTGGTTLTDFREYTIGVQGGSSSGLAGCVLRGNNASDFLDIPQSRVNLGVDTTANQTDSTNKRFVTDAEKLLIGDISGKQDALVSGTNIKTINGNSVLGSGNLSITGGGTPTQLAQGTAYTTLGELLNDSFAGSSLNATNWSTTSTDITVNNKLIVASGASDWSDYIESTKFFAYNKLELTIDFTAVTKNSGDAWGLSQAFYPRLSTIAGKIYFKFNQETGVFSYGNTVDANNVFAPPVDFVAGDNIVIKLKRHPSLTVVEIENITNTTVPKVFAEFPVSKWGTSGEPQIVFLGGQQEFNNVTVSSNVRNFGGTFGTVLIGDSITQGAGASTVQNQWTNLLFNNQQHLFENLGFNSWATNEFTALVTTELLGAINAKYCVIALGYNDQSRSVATATYTTRLETIASTAQGLGYETIMVTPFPRLVGSNAAYVAAMSTAATNSGSTFIDLTPYLGNIVDRDLIIDGVHPNDLGHKLKADAIKELSAELLEDLLTDIDNADVYLRGIKQSSEELPLVGIDELGRVAKLNANKYINKDWLILQPNLAPDNQLYAMQDGNIGVNGAIQYSNYLRQLNPTSQGLRINFSNNNNNTDKLGSNIDITNSSDGGGNSGVNFHNITGGMNMVIHGTNLKGAINYGISGDRNIFLNPTTSNNSADYLGDNNLVINGRIASMTTASNNIFLGGSAGNGIENGGDNIIISQRNSGSGTNAWASNTAGIVSIGPWGDFTGVEPFTNGEVHIGGYTRSGRIYTFGPKGGLTNSFVKWRAGVTLGTNRTAQDLGIEGHLGTGTGAEGALILRTGTGTTTGSTVHSLSDRLKLDKTAATFYQPIKNKGYTVATLPTGEEGMTAYVTDADSITYRATATGGGTGKALVFFDGTNWIYH
jgi:lysophospholipase L1-like esterase